MSKQFVKKRGPDCRCEYNFTCGSCLQNPPVYFWTSRTATEAFLQDLTKPSESSRK